MHPVASCRGQRRRVDRVLRCHRAGRCHTLDRRGRGSRLAVHCLLRRGGTHRGGPARSTTPSGLRPPSSPAPTSRRGGSSSDAPVRGVGGQHGRARLGGPVRTVDPRSSRLVLVGCVSQKRPHVSLARDLYVSWCGPSDAAMPRRPAGRGAISSAEHGLVMPSEVIAPYDRFCRTPSESSRSQYSMMLSHSSTTNC